MSSKTEGPVKAYLALVEPPKPKEGVPALTAITGKAKGGHLGKVEFMFNPESYKISKTASWGRPEGFTDGPVGGAQFTGSGPASVTLKLFLDHGHLGSPTVAADVDLLLSAVVPIPKTVTKNRSTPPWVIFGWGERVPMIGVATSVIADFLLFKVDGTPTRAEIEITLEEVPTEPMTKQNPTSGGDHTRHQHTVVRGDTLQSLAHQTYDDVSRWRDIAELNAIDDPSRLAPGRTLLLPSSTELVAQ